MIHRFFAEKVFKINIKISKKNNLDKNKIILYFLLFYNLYNTIIYD